MKRNPRPRISAVMSGLAVLLLAIAVPSAPFAEEAPATPESNAEAALLAQVEALQEARRTTEPGSHFLVDPGLREFEYLGRAAVALSDLQQIEEQERRSGYIITGQRTRNLDGYLRERNWRGRPLGTTPYVLWSRDTAARRSSN